VVVNQQLARIEILWKNHAQIRKKSKKKESFALISPRFFGNYSLHRTECFYLWRKNTRMKSKFQNTTTTTTDNNDDNNEPRVLSMGKKKEGAGAGTTASLLQQDDLSETLMILFVSFAEVSNSFDINRIFRTAQEQPLVSSSSSSPSSFLFIDVVLFDECLFV